MSDYNHDRNLGSLSPSPESKSEPQEQAQNQGTPELGSLAEKPEESLPANGITHVSAHSGGGRAADKPSAVSKIAFGVLLVVLLIGLGVLLAYKLGFLGAQAEELAPYESTQDAGSNLGHLTSSQSYTSVALPPPPEIPTPVVEPKVEEVKPEPKEEMPLPIPPAALNNSSNGLFKEEHVPTLEELKFAAPMMGNAGDHFNGGGSSSMADNPYSSSANLSGSMAGMNAGAAGTEGAGQSLGDMLKPVHTPSKNARVIKDRSLTLSKGTVIDCILETKVDTTVPGMTSCVVPRNVFSMDGRTLLVEKGTKAIGEYQGSVKNGVARIFMLWTELRTPNGISIALNSPATDHLGGAGMGGYVDFHWWQRFGNALLFSMVSDGFQYIVNNASKSNSDGDITYNNTSDGVDEIIKEAMAQSGNIPPTLIKNQGERVAIFVARDLNFSGVYSLSKH